MAALCQPLRPRAGAIVTEKFKCPICGKITAGRRVRLAWNKGTLDHGEISYRYNTDVRYPRRHRVHGEICKGSFMEADRCG
jgi:hypothetical protein